ncbi:MAG: hypothetical protein J0I48_13215 [Devosia sp.]|uniref:hypothetical protein n=1 Tax=Devosia sp. 66-22 TaxID=1895753 RepID=UPI0009289B19|nr:hypothetical protein [Devosia sp. 66-22]MBN9347138.1 hypothetical protein [Devosia sp.]OJX50576.1 MAG: hypothetical protein BGO81_20185 [Devosia sp. 66-22]
MKWLNSLWLQIVRLRTWLVNGAGVFIVTVLPLLGAPEIMAVIPPGYQKYVIAAAFVLNIVMRPRPAAVK